MRFAFLLIVIEAGCGRARAPARAPAEQEVRALLRSERFQDASTKLELSLNQAPSASESYWKLRILRAEILLAQRKATQAQTALDFQLPSGPRWNEDLARYRLCQGHAAVILHRYDEGRLLLDQAQALAQSAGAFELVAEIELRKGSLAVNRLSFHEAETDFRRVLDYAVRNQDHYLQMSAAGNMGYMFLNSFRYDEAILWFESALRHARAAGLTGSELRAMGNLGSCYYRLGDLDKALRYFQDAESRSTSATIQADRQIWLGNIGNILTDRHQYTAAVANYQRALEIARTLNDRSWIATCLSNLARTSIQTGEWDAAERYNQEARALKRELNDPNAEMYSTDRAARIAAGRREWARAARLFRSITSSHSKDPTLLLNARAGLADVLATAGRDKEAEAEFGSAMALVESERSKLLRKESRLIWFSSVIEFQQDYVEFLMTRGRTRGALEVAEGSRARVLADRLRLHRAPNAHTAAQFQKLAAVYRTTLLSYWLTPSKSYLWVITPAGISSFSLPSDSEIRSLVDQHHALIQSARDPLALDNPAGRKLYAMLIAPAREMIASAGKITIVPDGPLYSLNFETLPVFSGQPHYWIEDSTIVIAPSLALLSRQPRGSRASDSLLLIGNPVSPNELYPRLEFAGQEMAAIENGLPAFRKVVLQGSEAHPEAYVRSDPGRFSFIHFAAHAAANPQEPLDSAVILSRRGSGYKLFAKEIVNTPLQADLVTISACKSAGARTYAGEGLVGLAWAFLEAGARNVIAGLWDVDDRSTAAIMAQLYAELGRGAAPSTALRSAKLQMLRSSGAYRKPWYWGAFQVFTRNP